MPKPSSEASVTTKRWVGGRIGQVDLGQPIASLKQGSGSSGGISSGEDWT